MSTGAPEELYGCSATLSVTADDQADALTAVTTALADIKTALTTLANGTEFSLAEDPAQGAASMFLEPDGVNGVFSAQGSLLVGSVAQASAQSAAEAASAAITTALPSGATVTLQEEDGVYVFDLLQ